MQDLTLIALELNTRQIKRLAKRFGVSAEVFL
jgi:antitoxin component HigA of HigAB toxin-antitoxin module